jgi:hypothetical protein
MISKPKNKKAIIIVIAIFILVGLITFFAVRKKKATSNNETNAVFNAKTGQMETLTKENVDPSFFPLKRGSKNDYVFVLQNWLLKQKPSFLPLYGVDGDFGNETELAVVSIFGTTSLSLEQFKTLI